MSSHRQPLVLRSDQIFPVECDKVLVLFRNIVRVQELKVQNLVN